MAKFYKVTVGGIHLSSDGTSSGISCKLDIGGVEDLLTPVAGTVIPTASGAPVVQMIAWTSGKYFEIKIETHLYKQQWDDLKELLTGSLENGTSFTVAGTGDIGDFDVTASAFPQKPFSAASFRHGRIEKPVFRFITVD